MEPDTETLVDEISETLPEVSGWLADQRLLSATDWKLTVAQMRVLRALPDRVHCTTAELAHRLGVSQSALVGLADGLAQLGLIERNPSPSDRRIIYLRLSRAGRDARDASRWRRRRRTEAILRRLPPHQLREVAESVAVLRQALMAARPERSTEM